MSRTMNSTNCSLTTSNPEASVLQIASNTALSVVLTLIAITSVLSNFLVIVSVAKTPSLQNPANLMLCGLSLNDLLSSSSTVPLFLTSRLMLHLHASVCTYEAVKNIYRLCLYIFTPASFLLLCLLSWDRYKAISNPLTYRAESSKSKTLKKIAAVWMAWAVGGVLLVLGPRDVPRRIFIAGFGSIVLIILVSMQVATYRAMQRHNREIVGTVSAALSREKKLATTLRFVLAALTFSLAVPWIVYTLMLHTRTKFNYQSEIIGWRNAFVFMNSCVNPLIYFLRHPGMRTAAFGLLDH